MLVGDAALTIIHNSETTVFYDPLLCFIKSDSIDASVC